MLFEFRDVSYSYEDGSPGLQHVNAAVEWGESVAVLGANGSGKSTFLRLLDGLVFPESGAIFFEGVDIGEGNLKACNELNRSLRSTVGFVFQNADAQLFNATVEEELAFGPIQLGLTPEEVAIRVFETMAFLGIEHLADRPPFRLSGGEKRKVAIASVLSMNPSVLILDEPFLGLDPRSQKWLLRTLTQLQVAGKTTIVATHTLEIMPLIAKRVILLSETHQILKDGSVENVLADQELLAEANVIEKEHALTTQTS